MKTKKKNFSFFNQIIQKRGNLIKNIEGGAQALTFKKKNYWYLNILKQLEKAFMHKNIICVVFKLIDNIFINEIIISFKKNFIPKSIHL